MPSIALIVPGSLDAISGGSIYDKRLALGLRDRGWTVQVRALASSDDADAALSALETGTTVLVDGLIFGAAPEAVARHGARLRLVPVVHLPLADEPGLDAVARRDKETSERRALAHATLVVVTGKATVETIAGYGVARERIAVLEPGTDHVPVARGSGRPVHFLCVATLNPGKGHDVLLGALAANRHRDWRLTCVGNTERYPQTVAAVRELIRSLDLGDRVSLTGELDGDRLAAAYDAADAFVLATRFETYGMAIAEALARGLPVLSTSTGAIPTLLGDGAGIVVAPDDRDGLAGAIARFLDDGTLREELRAGALRARVRLRSWETAVDEMGALLATVVSR